MAETKVIAVTGASRGIGAAIAIELARAGHRVGCLSRGGRLPVGAEHLVDKARLVSLACDVTDEASLRQALAALVAEAGRLDALVNNAGIHMEAPSDQLATAEYERVMATNATALFVACREAYPHLVRSGGGTIVNIGSFYDKLGVKRNLAYCASKAAVGAITRCLAVEWARQGIRVLDVAPGYIVTDINRAAMQSGPLADYLRRRIPGGKIGQETEVARLVRLILDEDVRFLTGETIYMDGGQGMAL